MISVGRCVCAMTFATVNVLPEPVMPSNTWPFSPRASPSTSFSIACGWSRVGEEGLLLALVRQREDDVHHRARRRFDRALVEAVALVDRCVEHARLLAVLLLDLHEAAALLEHLKHVAHQVDRERRRGVVER